MNKRRLVVVCASATVCTCLIGGYVAGIPPFERRAKVNAEDVCPSLGNSRKAAQELSDILPANATPSFAPREESHELATYPHYESSCFATEDDETLFSSRASLANLKSITKWESTVRSNQDISENPKRLQVGHLGITTERLAAVYIPCTKRKEINNAPWNLSIVTTAKKEPAGTPQESKQSLINLTFESARRAHEKAHCDLPSKLPAKAPKV